MSLVLEKSNIIKRPGGDAGRVVKKPVSIAGMERFLNSFRLYFIVVLIAAVVGTGYFIYVVYNDNISLVRQRIEQKEKGLADQRTELAKLKAAKVNLAELSEPAQKILQILPEKKELPSIIMQIEALAAKHNLFLAALDAADDKSAEVGKKRLPLQKLLINISLTGGDYYALKGFLADAEKNLRLFDVRSLAYAPDTKSFNLSLAAYYYNE